jgi:membrane-associated phospholipid phosphatase
MRHQSVAIRKHRTGARVTSAQVTMVAVAGGLLAALAALLALAGAAALWAAAHHAELRAALGALSTRPWLVRQRSRHPRIAGFVIARLSPRGTWGLSYTVGLAGLGLALVGFGAVTGDVLGREDLAAFDLPVTILVAAWRVPWLTGLMRGITMLGSFPVIAGLIAATGVFLRIRTGSWRPVLLLAAVSAGAAGLDVLVKYAIARPRPPVSFAVTAAPGFAYPSGHTVQAAAYGCMAYLIARSARSWRVKIGAWAAALMIAVLVGLSRVYLGVHWLTDVMGGWALATAWLAFVLIVTAALGRRPGLSLRPPPARW